MRTNHQLCSVVLQRLQAFPAAVCIDDLIDHEVRPTGNFPRGYVPDFPQISTGYKTVGQALNDLVDMKILKKERRVGPMGKSRMYYWEV